MNARIYKELAISPGDIVAFMGAGGKTTLMLCLGRELSRRCRVLITTTTKIYRPEPGQAKPVILAETLDEAISQLSTRWETEPCVVLGHSENDEGKLLGVPAGWFPSLRAAFPDCVILVEADGAMGRWLKGHLAHEPVIPAATTLVVSLMGLAVIGKPLDSRYVHRPEVVASHTGLDLGGVITPAHAALALSVQLRLAAKQAPWARQVLWLNVSGEEDEVSRLFTGRLVARHFSRLMPGRQVFIGEARAKVAIWESWPPAAAVAGVVLAAGLSTRLGGEKMFLPWRGRALLRHAVENLLLTSVAAVAVVLGHRAKEAKQLLLDLPIETVENPAYGSGLGTSAQAAAKFLIGRQRSCHGVLFALGDQPRLAPATIDILVQTFCTYPSQIIYPTYEGKRGNPVIFPAELLGEFLSLGADQGGREIMERYRERLCGVEVADDAVLNDIDTPADYEQLLKID